MPFYFGDYLADTMHLTTEQHGAYVLLLFAGWKAGGALPDDDQQLAAITKASAARWRSMRAVIQQFYTVAGGKWNQKRLSAELSKAHGYVQAQSENGRKGGRPRKAGGNPEGNPGGSQPKPKSKPKRKPNETPSPSPSPTSLPSPSPGTDTPTGGSSASRASRAPRKTPIPEGFSISTRVRHWATEKGHDRLEQHLDAFVSKAKAKGYAYADWDEGFMGAIRDDWAKLRNGRQTDNRAAAAEAGRRIFGSDQERDITGESERI